MNQLHIHKNSLPHRPRNGFLSAAIGIASLVAVATCPAQTTTPVPADSLDATAAISSSSLPDAPDAVTSRSVPEEQVFTSVDIQHQPLKMAGRYDKYIAAGQPAPRLNAHDKVILGVRDAVSPFSAVGWVIAAGYAQAVNGSPNYGQTGKGFAQRLGAAAARSSSEGIFGDSVLAPILHEDPRYYKMGSGHNFVKRLVYAGTRPLITRTDGGRSTPNFSLLGGELAGAALTQAYYPPLNRGFTEVARTFGGSVGSTALGFVVTEFLADTLQVFHLKSRP